MNSSDLSLEHRHFGLFHGFDIILNQSVNHAAFFLTEIPCFAVTNTAAHPPAEIYYRISNAITFGLEALDLFADLLMVQS